MSLPVGHTTGEILFKKKRKKTNTLCILTIFLKGDFKLPQDFNVDLEWRINAVANWMASTLDEAGDRTESTTAL
jgi:hypothetical protein